MTQVMETFFFLAPQGEVGQGAMQLAQGDTWLGNDCEEEVSSSCLAEQTDLPFSRDTVLVLAES